MSTNDIERVKIAVRTAIEPPEQPSKAQVSEICKLTYLNEARKEIQRVLNRRLTYPDSYTSLEVFHALILIQECLLNASSDFVNFCVDNVQFVVALKNHRRPDIPAERAGIGLIRSGATSLSKILLDPVRLADKRRAVSAESTSTVAAAPPPIWSRAVPLPSPPSSPEKAKTVSISPRVALRSILPTPDPTPPKPFSRLADDSVTTNAQVPAHNTKPSISVLLLKKEDVAMITFRSDKDGLESVLDALDNLLSHQHSVKMHPDDLVKALTCVHHCLYWGSAPFVVQCRERMAKFDALRQHSIAQVRGHAEAVVNLLNNHSRLQEERQSRAPLMPSGPATQMSVHEPVHEARGHIIVLEPVFDISRSVTKSGTRPFAGGGFSDVWKGVYRSNGGTEIVAIKFLRRLSKVPPERLQKRLNRELHVWRTLLHKNICPFYGIILEVNTDVGMVSPFYPNGNILDYVKQNQHINPLEMLQGIADGVSYLHAKKIVHGDIKCANAMVSDEGTPRLIDFGLAQVIDGFAEVTGYTTSNLASSLRWSAPELLIGEASSSSKSEKSDVYAFASTCIEIMTLKCPYPELKDPQVMNRIIYGKQPERPPVDVKWSPSDELWEFLTTCWETDPQHRPNIVAVRRKLAEFYNGVDVEAVSARKVRFSRSS